MRVLEFQSYSPIHDKEIVRLSMADTLGQEYYVILTETEGRVYRDMRERAIETLMDAIENCDPPGEVEVYA